MPRPYFAPDVHKAGFKTAPTTLSISAVSARTATMPGGLYELWSSVDCNFLVGGSGVTATTSHVPLTAKTVKYVMIDEDAGAANTYIAAIAGGAGTLFITPLVA